MLYVSMIRWKHRKFGMLWMFRCGLLRNINIPAALFLGHSNIWYKNLRANMVELGNPYTTFQPIIDNRKVEHGMKAETCGDNWGSSFGWVCIHPKGSKSFRKSCSGRADGRCTCWWVPHWGGIAIQRISLTWGLSGGLTPYKYPEIWVLRSAMHMNFFNMFLGMMYVYPVSCIIRRT